MPSKNKRRAINPESERLEEICTVAKALFESRPDRKRAIVKMAIAAITEGVSATEFKFQIMTEVLNAKKCK